LLYIHVVFLQISLWSKPCCHDLNSKETTTKIFLHQWLVMIKCQCDGRGQVESGEISAEATCEWHLISRSTAKNKKTQILRTASSLYTGGCRVEFYWSTWSEIQRATYSCFFITATTILRGASFRCVWLMFEILRYVHMLVHIVIEFDPYTKVWCCCCTVS